MASTVTPKYISKEALAKGTERVTHFPDRIHPVFQPPPVTIDRFSGNPVYPKTSNHPIQFSSDEVINPGYLADLKDPDGDFISTRHQLKFISHQKAKIQSYAS